MLSLIFYTQNMGEKMKEKFSKYWGDPEKMNSVIFFANILIQEINTSTWKSSSSNCLVKKKV